MLSAHAGDGGVHQTHSYEANGGGDASRAVPKKASFRNGYSNVGDSEDEDEEDQGGLIVGGTRGVSRKTKKNYVGVNASGEDQEEEEQDEEVKEGDKTSGRLAIFALLNLVYVVLQLAGSLAFDSLALMSDGFHNLSDVAAILMAMYIHKLQRRRCPENAAGGSDELPHGFKRAEVIGGLINSVALVSLSAYIVLNAIPRLFAPTEVGSGWLYVSLAFGGVLVNLVGVIFFMSAGEDGHDLHGGGFLHAHNHSHDHGHEDEAPAPGSLGLLTLVDPYDASPSSEESEEEVSVQLARSVSTKGAFLLGGRGKDEEEGVGHEEAWVGGGNSREHDNSHGRGHSHEHAHGHGHAHEVSAGRGGRGDDVNGHGCHDDYDVNGRCGGNGHRGAVVGVVEMCRRPGSLGSAAVGEDGGRHDHRHGDEGHGKRGGGGCSNGHGHGHAEDWHGAGGGGCSAGGGHGKSMNLWAVLMHAIADAVSAGIVCLQGAVIMFFGSRDGVNWTDYLDPITSIALSVFMVYCALPVIVECAHVLLEGTPRGTDVSRLRKELMKVRGVSSVQNLSVIQLNSEEPFVASLTLVVIPADEEATTTTTVVGGGASHGRGASAPIAGGVELRPQSRAIVRSAKAVLARHNIGRSTVEIEVLESVGSDGTVEFGWEEGRRRRDGRSLVGAATGNADTNGHQGCLGGTAGSRAHGHSHGHGHSHDAVAVDSPGCGGHREAEEVSLASTAIDFV